MSTENNLQNIDSDLSGMLFLPEAGRASWIWVTYVLARYLTEPHDEWGIITGGVAQNKNNKWQIFFTVKDASHSLHGIKAK